MGGGQLLKCPPIVSVYYKSTFRGAFSLYNTNGHATMETRPVNQLRNCPLFSPLLLISLILRMFNQRNPMTVNLEFTVEEARAYEEALSRAVNNPFIQDDDECAPLLTLMGKIGAACDSESFVY